LEYYFYIIYNYHFAKVKTYFFKLFGEFIILTLFFFQKYFGILKNGQKKCPKLKRAEGVWENIVFVTEMKN